MTDVLRPARQGENAKPVTNGLEPGYAEEKWGPWKSHKLLLSEAIRTIPDWSSRAGVLGRTFAAFAKARPGFLSEKEFGDILNSFVCCEEIFYHHFFQLFDRDQDGFLSEVDFVSGMLAVSPVTEHDLTRPSGLLRLQLIFLYYDANRNGRLDVEELSLMIEHLEQLRESGANEKGPKLELRELAVNDAKSLMALYKGGFWYRCLYDACMKGMLSGMDQLLRTGGDLCGAILRVNPQLAVGPTPLANSMSPVRPAPVQPVPQVFQPAPRMDDLSPPGVSTIAGAPNNVSSLGGFTPVSFFPVQKIPQMAKLPVPANYGTRQSLGSHIVDGSATPKAAGPMPLPLRLIRGLMEFNGDWKSLRLCTGAELIEICNSVLPIFAAEDSLVATPFPVRVYGDIHGNLPDLTQFFNKYAWPDKRKGDILSMNYVFLGDYVDRGSFSVETVALLFSLKIMYPNRVFLLRGNHEDRSMNYHFGLRKSCLAQFGASEGQLIWERINECFDNLPLACLVGEEVLCIHGGIGASIESVNDLAGIAKPITVPPENVDPETLSKVDKVVVDALWSDPVGNNGNPMDSPRGNGATKFTADRVKEFVKANHLQFIVRGHQCVPNGYEYFADGLLLTVFSAANYCNQYNNDGGMVAIVRNPDGSLEEHAQILKANLGTAIGWDTEGAKPPTPMRNVYQSVTQVPQGPRPGMPFVPVKYPASPSVQRMMQ
jgi:diadenosine tetraphosphatase ApaH/serine/threonine PP2A family protein phosphatase/Ca2+-binding EF-hand superfamily protein